MHIDQACLGLPCLPPACRVRTGESNLGNFVCDVWREACRCDVALLNGGTLRSGNTLPLYCQDGALPPARG